MDRRAFLAGLLAAGFVASAPASLLSSTSVFALQPGEFAVGDTFTINGVFAVDPVTRLALPWLKTFTVISETGSSRGLR